jgi:hypothetical protein
MNREVANLGRARSRCHFRLKQAEDLAQSYRDNLADLESRIRAFTRHCVARHRWRLASPPHFFWELSDMVKVLEDWEAAR